jgi:hypothetical protein
MTTSFQSLLDTPAGTVEAPKPLPPGLYTFTVTAKELGESSKSKTPQVTFMCKPVSADAVDDDELEAFGGIEAAMQKTSRVTYYITPDALYRLTEFCSNYLGIDSSLTVGEQIDNAVGCSFVGSITQRLDPNDSSKVYTDLKPMSGV